MRPISNAVSDVASHGSLDIGSMRAGVIAWPPLRIYNAKPYGIMEGQIWHT